MSSELGLGFWTTGMGFPTVEQNNTDQLQFGPDWVPAGFRFWFGQKNLPTVWMGLL